EHLLLLDTLLAGQALTDALGQGCAESHWSLLSLRQPHVPAAGIVAGWEERAADRRSRGLLRTPTMTRADRALVILLRLLGATALFALVAISGSISLAALRVALPP